MSQTLDFNHSAGILRSFKTVRLDPEGFQTVGHNYQQIEMMIKPAELILLEITARTNFRGNRRELAQLLCGCKDQLNVTSKVVTNCTKQLL